MQPTKSTNLHKQSNIYKALKGRTLNPIHNSNNTTHYHRDKNIKNQTLKTNKTHLKRARPTGLAQIRTTSKNSSYSTPITIHTKNSHKPLTKQTNTAIIILNNNIHTQKITTYIPNKYKINTCSTKTKFEYQHIKVNNTPLHKHYTKI